MVEREGTDSWRNNRSLTQMIRNGTPYTFQELSQGRKLDGDTVLTPHWNSAHVIV